jgi:hypothetical protein
VSRVLVVAVLLCVAVYGAVYSRYRLDPGDLLDARSQDHVVAFLRAALDGRPPAALADGLERIRPAGPTWITLFRSGEVLLRHKAEDPTLRERIQAAARAIRAWLGLQRLTPETRRGIRIKVDTTTATGPIFTAIPLYFAHSVVAGRDGLGLSVDARRAYLLPDDMLRRDLLAGDQPFAFMEEFRSGVDLKAAVNFLADQLELSASQWSAHARRYFRFRVQSFVEDLTKSRALAVDRCRVPVYRINRRSVREAIVRAADYVLRQIRPDGSFAYIYYPATGTHLPPGEYSLPRHAGTTWFLSLAYRVTRDPRYREGAIRAIDYLGARGIPSQCKATPYACIGEAHEADLGSAAISIVAMVEYQQATGDARFESLARRLGQFILWMQKDNGDFCHQYDPMARMKNCKDILLYYSGEAALSLAMLHRLTKDATWVKPLERALDFLTGENYDFFLGQFFIGEDHWTCIAAEAAFEAVNKDQYAHFCYEFARLNARAQVQPREGPLDDLRGVFAVTPFFMPHNTPAGSRTESNVATYLLSLRRGEPQTDILRSLRLSIRYLVDQQIRPESSYLFPHPEAASGGMMQTPMRPNVRIDFVQHAAAAMARGIDLVPETWWSGEESDP